MFEKNREKQMENLIKTGRLPITKKNIEIILDVPEISKVDSVINQKSADAGLVILGFREEQIKHDGEKVFQGYDGLGTVLFVNSNNQKAIE